MSKHLRPLCVLALALTAPVGCFEFSDFGADDVSNVEMREALDEVVLAGQGQAVENEIIEITTDFTLGEAAQTIANKLRDALESQIPCSTITAQDNTLTLDFGGLDDTCFYNGHTIAGIITLEITYDAIAGEAVVVHNYQDLTNGVVTLTGTKTVTWDEQSRHVVSDLMIARDGQSVHSTSDRIMTLLDPAAGLAGGIILNGGHHWDNNKGPWDLAIDGVEVRWQDPVPQAGDYTLDTPKGKTIGLGFDRVDDDTIAVTLSSGGKQRVFHVSRSGQVDDA
ncbi:MAG: hypothetical protein H0T76_00240 [Nannocystis sp.]|nr:hypothetical protein [Nannocystis sp.]MBA3544888.1 hypothetical protein [Nannocystis sp.]